MNGHGGENHYLIAGDGSFFPLADLGVAITGMGDIPVNYVTSHGHRQHGYTVDDWLLEGRSLAFTFDRFARNRAQFWQRREALFNVLSPESGIVTYRRVLPDGSRRDIQGWVEGLAANPAEDGLHFPVSFTLKCPDPSWFDPTPQTVAIERGNGELTFPVTFPITFGVDGLGTTEIVNEGSWRTYPVITASGPFAWIAFTNETTGALFSITLRQQEGQTTSVDLTPGRQSVTRDGENIFNALGDDSNLGDWYLAPGSNTVSVSTSEDTDDTSGSVQYYNRYIAL